MSSWLCVPLPAPGGPKRTMLIIAAIFFCKGRQDNVQRGRLQMPEGRELFRISRSLFVKIRKISAQPVVIQPVAKHKFVVELEADVFHIDIFFPRFVLAEQGDRFDGFGAETAEV